MNRRFSPLTSAFKLVLFALMLTQVVSAQSYPKTLGPDLEFKRGTIIQVFFTAFRPGSEQDLQQAGRALFPVSQEYGARVMGRFMVLAKEEQGPGIDQQPHVYSFVEWPDLESYLRFLEDPRTGGPMSQRNGATTYMNENNFFTVAEDRTLTIDSGKFYEFFTGVPRTEVGAENTSGVVLHRILLSGSSRTTAEEASVTNTDPHYHHRMAALHEWTQPDEVAQQSAERTKQFSEYVSLLAKFGFPPAE